MNPYRQDNYRTPRLRCRCKRDSDGEIKRSAGGNPLHCEWHQWTQRVKRAVIDVVICGVLLSAMGYLCVYVFHWASDPIDPNRPASVGATFTFFGTVFGCTSVGTLVLVGKIGYDYEWGIPDWIKEPYRKWRRSFHVTDEDDQS